MPTPTVVPSSGVKKPMKVSLGTTVVKVACLAEVRPWASLAMASAGHQVALAVLDPHLAQLALGRRDAQRAGGRHVGGAVRRGYGDDGLRDLLVGRRGTALGRRTARTARGGQQQHHADQRGRQHPYRPPRPRRVLQHLQAHP
jgi:hypothetical protein